MKPLKSFPDLTTPPTWPNENSSDGIITRLAHPFRGGETVAYERVDYLLANSIINSYEDTKDGFLGSDNTTKLSAYLALGCITARQIHANILLFETGDSAVESLPKLSASLELQKEKL